jgi:hypothetical protein
VISWRPSSNVEKQTVADRKALLVLPHALGIISPKDTKQQGTRDSSTCAVLCLQDLLFTHRGLVSVYFEKAGILHARNTSFSVRQGSELDCTRIGGNVSFTGGSTGWYNTEESNRVGALSSAITVLFIDYRLVGLEV